MSCIVSHKYKFIFIHVPRTGGTAFFSRFSPFWELLQNDSVIPIWHRRTSFFKEKFPEEWQSYFKFAFVRNPWDRAVSMWKIKDPGAPLVGFLNKLIDKRFSRILFVMPQSYWIGDGSELDHVARFEDYNIETAYLMGRLGFELKKLDIVRVTPNRERDYRYYYNQKTIDLVSKFYKPDIEAFGYSYDES